MKKKIKNKIIRFFRWFYLKLFRLHDSPQRIAFGFGLGAFLGILPGTGPIAALVLAAIFRINKAAALLGSLLTNTWLSLAVFLFSAKIGSAIMGSNWEKVSQDWGRFLRDFHWINLLKISALKVILPVACGYLIIGFALGSSVYLLSLAMLKVMKRRQNTG
jgi:hypothetical protein